MKIEHQKTAKSHVFNNHSSNPISFQPRLSTFKRGFF
jgi:hypothetical protein